MTMPTAKTLCSFLKRGTIPRCVLSAGQRILERIEILLTICPPQNNQFYKYLAMIHCEMV